MININESRRENQLLNSTIVEQPTSHERLVSLLEEEPEWSWDKAPASLID